MNGVVLESVLNCPHCGFATRGTVPTDACLIFYECRNCILVPALQRTRNIGDALTISLAVKAQ